MPSRDSGLPHDTRNIVGASGNVSERLPAREGKTSTLFNNSDTEGNTRGREHWNEARTANFVDTCNTLPKRNLSQWCGRWSEVSDFGIASGKISKLESKRQEWSMFTDSKINWRSYDIAIDYRWKRFPLLWYAWCDDCVCIEETSRQTCSFPKKE